MSESGKLYVVATPIGNLGDMSLRAVDTLKSVELVLAEDTRSFGILKKHFEIETRAQSYHDHSERTQTPGIIELLKAGKNIALVSEAGTPTISDPGYRLIKACQEEGIIVRAVPGPSAVIAALSISGFPTDRFTFEGFLPPSGGKRRKRLAAALEREETSVLYESPFRILKLIDEVAAIDPTRELFLAREITKFHEETVNLPAAEMSAALKQRASIKGECVLLVHGKP